MDLLLGSLLLGRRRRGRMRLLRFFFFVFIDGFLRLFRLGRLLVHRALHGLLRRLRLLLGRIQRLRRRLGGFRQTRGVRGAVLLRFLASLFGAAAVRLEPEARGRVRGEGDGILAAELRVEEVVRLGAQPRAHGDGVAAAPGRHRERADEHEERRRAGREQARGGDLPSRPGLFLGRGICGHPDVAGARERRARAAHLGQQRARLAVRHRGRRRDLERGRRRGTRRAREGVATNALSSGVTASMEKGFLMTICPYEKKRSAPGHTSRKRAPFRK